MMVRFLGLSFAILFLSFNARGASIVPVQYTLFRHGSAPEYTQTLTDWWAVGYAFTASELTGFPVGASGVATVEKATFVAVWKPAYTGAASDLGLFACPPLSAGAGSALDAQCGSPIAFFAGNYQGACGQSPSCTIPYGDSTGCSSNGGNVMPCVADVTTLIQGFIAGTLPKVGSPLALPIYLSIGTRSDGSNAPVLYNAELWIWWSVP